MTAIIYVTRAIALSSHNVGTLGTSAYQLRTHTGAFFKKSKKFKFKNPMGCQECR